MKNTIFCTAKKIEFWQTDQNFGYISIFFYLQHFANANRNFIIKYLIIFQKLFCLFIKYL